MITSVRPKITISNRKWAHHHRHHRTIFTPLDASRKPLDPCTAPHTVHDPEPRPHTSKSLKPAIRKKRHRKRWPWSWTGRGKTPWPAPNQQTCSKPINNLLCARTTFPPPKQRQGCCYRGGFHTLTHNAIAIRTIDLARSVARASVFFFGI